MVSSSENDNLLGLARTALVGGNNEEALIYFNRVLEANPRLSEAWIGKGKSAVWQSNLSNFRINEAIIAFNHAISTADEHNKASVRLEVLEELNRVIVALYNLARNHMINFVSLDNSWADYLLQVSQLLDGLEAAKEWDSDNTITLENIIHLCKDNIEGYSYRDEFDNTPLLHSITPEYEALLRYRMETAIAALQNIDSTYQPPQIEKKEADSCFIITATMGDFNHPNVTLLRQFRDEWIFQKQWGASFVKQYYHYGPIAAKIIKKSKPLKVITYILIVLPASLLARFLLR